MRYDVKHQIKVIIYSVKYLKIYHMYWHKMLYIRKVYLLSWSSDFSFCVSMKLVLVLDGLPWHTQIHGTTRMISTDFGDPLTSSSTTRLSSYPVKYVNIWMEPLFFFFNDSCQIVTLFRVFIDFVFSHEPSENQCVQGGFTTFFINSAPSTLQLYCWLFECHTDAENCPVCKSPIISTI